MTKFTTCIWSNYTAEEQVEFYASLLPDGRVLGIHRTPADTPSQKAGDVITEIAQESVSTPQDAADRVASLKKQGRKNALLMLASKSGELRFVTVRMD